MKLYEVCSVRDSYNVEEYQEYLGFDLEKAISVKKNTIADNAIHLTVHEKIGASVELRVYEISDDVDVNDENALVDAICDCAGYDVI